MNELLEILKYTIPALIVFFTAFFMIRSFLKNDQARRRFEIRLANQKTITPIRLQAYERIILFLERIAPDNLIMRLNDPKISARELQSQMLSTIRSEFDHNLSQQLYISSHGWEMVKSAKANIIKIINTQSDALGSHASSIDLSRKILEHMAQLKKYPHTAAIEYLKKEMQHYF